MKITNPEKSKATKKDYKKRMKKEQPRSISDINF